MPDKTFNEQPMIVVVANSLDQRIQRQLKSQLQSEMMSVAELDAEIKNQESMQAIKQQYDSKKDESEFDENETKEQANAEPIEQTANDNSGNGEQGNESGGKADPFSAGGDDTGAAPANAENGQPSGKPAPAQDQGSGQANGSDGGTSEDAFSTDAGNVQGNEQSQGKQDPNAADQSQQAGSNDPFDGDSGQAQAKETPQQNSSATKANTGQQQNQKAGNNAAAGTESDDPFSDDVKFEAFAGIFDDTRLKFEDANKQTSAEKDSVPPLKQFVYLRGTDRGVDERTNAVVAALEDPQNVVAVLDLSEIAETEAKMQFSSVKKALQERGVTVVDTVDQAVEYLNDVYDQIDGKAE